MFCGFRNLASKRGARAKPFQASRVGLALRRADDGPIAPVVRLDGKAGVGHQLEHLGLHPALGQPELQYCIAHLRSPFVSEKASETPAL